MTTATRYNVAAIPDDLKKLDRWMVFQCVPQSSGKPKKIPLIAGTTGMQKARSDDPSTWRPFELALRDAEVRGLYLGFVFGREINHFLIDADSVINESGFIREDVVEVCETLNTYTELSVSGNGLHIIGRGSFPERCEKTILGFELFPLRGPRMCLITGDIISGLGTIEDRQSTLDALFPPRQTAHANGSTSSAAFSGPVGDLTPEEQASIVSWGKPLWVEGKRHHMATFLAGFLAKEGVSREQGHAIIAELAKNDPEPENAQRAAEDTWDKLEAGGDVAGWQGLREKCDVPAATLEMLSGLLNAWKDRIREANLIPFPIDVFSGPFRRYVEECAIATNVPPEMIAVPLMANIGGVIGDRVYIHLKNAWQEYAGLYVMLVSGPGTRKTAAIKHAEFPLEMLQFDEDRRHKAAMRDFDRVKKEWKDNGKVGDEPEPPKRRDIYTTDSTLEKVAVMLEGTPGLVVSTDELLTWVKGLNQYRSGGDREAYMSMWQNKRLKVDRKGSGSVRVDKPVISVSGGLQPDVVSSLAGSPDVLDGWLDRLLPVMPEVPVSTWRRDEDIHPQTRPAITSLFRAIDSIPQVDPNSERDGGLPPGLGIKLSVEADRVWHRWYDENSKLVHEEGGLLGGYYTKLEAYVTRFALILHILSNPPLTEYSTHSDQAHRLSPLKRMITRDEMSGAIELAEYFRCQIKEFQVLLKTPSAKTKRKVGLLARIERFISRNGREYSTDTVELSTVEVNSALCVTSNELLRGLRVLKEDITNELDTCIDHRVFTTTTLSRAGNPPILYCVEPLQ